MLPRLFHLAPWLFTLLLALASGLAAAHGHAVPAQMAHALPDRCCTEKASPAVNAYAPELERQACDCGGPAGCGHCALCPALYLPAESTALLSAPPAASPRLAHAAALMLGAAQAPPLPPPRGRISVYHC